MDVLNEKNTLYQKQQQQQQQAKSFIVHFDLQNKQLLYKLH